MKKILLTHEGKKKLYDELNNLVKVVRPEVIEELKEARKQGDLSENADYDASKNRQAEVEGRIKEIEEILRNVKVISNKELLKEHKIISLGSTVEYKKINSNKVYKIKIVGIIEADPFLNTISNNSPIAKALLGHVVKDIVEVITTTQVYKIEILNTY